MAAWQSDLEAFFKGKTQAKEQATAKASDDQGEAKEFISSVVLPAFRELKPELEKYGKTVEVNGSGGIASISVNNGLVEEIRYTVKVRGLFPYPEIHFQDRGQRYVSEGFFRSGSQDYTVHMITKDEVIRHFLDAYKTHAR